MFEAVSSNTACTFASVLAAVCGSEQTPQDPAKAPPPPAPPAPAQTPQSTSEQGSTATMTRPAPTPSKPKLDELPPFKVLLHNDDVNDMVWVVQTIVELTTIKPKRAVEIMLEADQSGVSLMLVTHKERAELYVEQFKSKNLSVSIEPA